MEFLNYAQLIIGPAGSGKSTYCKIIQEHGLAQKRLIKVVNLDPAAEQFNYKCDVDIRDLIKVSDVMTKYKLGPNGALIYCMEYLRKHIDWLEDKFAEFGESVYYLFDCPGQLELYSHYDIMKRLMNHLKKAGFSICSVFCLDCTFLQEQSKYISINVLSLGTMIQLELPHLTVMTKCDLMSKSELLEKIEEGLEPADLVQELNPYFGKKMNSLNQALVEMIKNYSLVEFNTLNINDEDSINQVLYNADNILQYFESQDPKDDVYDQAEKDMMQIDPNENEGFY